MAFKPGENVGPYRVIEQLGQGGMASVYKAYHAALDRYVALKVLHQAFNEDSTFIGRFQREAKVVARLEHPNIVPIYDFAEDEGRPYLVMKFIEGDTLKARMNEGPLTAKEIERVVQTVGSALGYAHRQGVLHRDIKPSNVLLSNDNIMYLADFGLARIAQAGESTLSNDSVMGTPQYISPEQAMGMKDLDGKTDIYSFGVMLYEMVVGQVPFSADTPFSIIHDHIYTPLPLPQKINPNVPEPVQRVLLKALAKNRLDRYETVEELMGAFKAAWLEAGVPIRGSDVTLAVEPPQRVEKAQEPNPLKSPAKKRVSWMWPAIGVVFILCLVFGFLALRNSLPASSQTEIAPTSPPQTQIGQIPPPPALGATPTLIPQDQLTPEIQKAYELVRLNPGDPNAHLELSLAFWGADMKLAAIEEYGQASNLAGLNNNDFYLTAAARYKDQEAWHLAAGMYLRAMPILFKENGSIPENIKDDFRESAFKGASEKEMPLIVRLEKLPGFESDYANIIRGRHALYTGDLTTAESLLALVLPLQDQFKEVHLLKAELAIQKGNPAEASQILTVLAGDPSAPLWVVDMAQDILKNIQ